MSPLRPRRHLLVLGALTCLAGVGAALAQGNVARSEDEVKAAFLYHFTHFVEWPQAPGSADAEFVVAVLGTDHFCAVVERTLLGKSAQDRPLLVRRVSGLADVANARVLFVGGTGEQKLPEILRRMEGMSVLTVGDAEGFAERGGIIGFRTVDNRVRLDINAEQAHRSGLRISSEVLKLARLVRTGKTP